LSPGDFVIIDDYGGMPPCRQAVEDYRAKAGIDAPLTEIDWTGVFWQKPAGDERRPRFETTEAVGGTASREAPAPAAKAERIGFE
jgi:O-methyltransferase